MIFAVCLVTLDKVCDPFQQAQIEQLVQPTEEVDRSIFGSLPLIVTQLVTPMAGGGADRLRIHPS